MTRRVMMLLPAAALALVGGCTPSNIADGGGSEVTNGICVAAGAAREGVTVIAFPETYVPTDKGPGPIFTVSDSAGRFAVKLPDGRFNLLFRDTLSNRGAFVAGVTKGQDAGTIALDSLGSLSGTVVRSARLSARMPIDVHIPGSPFYAVLTDDSVFTFQRVPPGAYSVVVHTVEPAHCDPGLICSRPGTDISRTVPASVSQGESVRLETIVISPVQ